MVSDLNQCEFCVDVTQSQLKQFGLSDDQIEKLYETTDEKEKAALEYAQAATKEAYKIDPQVIKKVKNYFSDAELVYLTTLPASATH